MQKKDQEKQSESLHVIMQKRAYRMQRVKKWNFLEEL